MASSSINPIAIVGAGPGAEDLLTIRAYERLKKAEVLIWTDSLVSPNIAKLVSKECEKITTSNLTLEEIVELLINRYQNNKRIVRLHDGDPSLYGAISEQICLLKDNNIEVEVIPGISAYQATAAELKKELTIPGIVQTVILSRAAGITGIPKKESLERIASLGGSLCLYLSARHVEEVERILLEHYDSKTPVAIGYRVSWDDQFIKIITLDSMAKITKEKGLTRTTLYIISPAFSATRRRSKLYSSSHGHLFRAKKD